ncbi:hypothetical protein C8R46DRAFT_91777 [Mycena filopes]|nr:hypothetical protein C8R46DRAFT_91777 [Mycena filopes]
MCTFAAHFSFLSLLFITAYRGRVSPRIVSYVCSIGSVHNRNNRNRLYPTALRAPLQSSERGPGWWQGCPSFSTIFRRRYCSARERPKNHDWRWHSRLVQETRPKKILENRSKRWLARFEIQSSSAKRTTENATPVVVYHCESQAEQNPSKKNVPRGLQKISRASTRLPDSTFAPVSRLNPPGTPFVMRTRGLDHALVRESSRRHQRVKTVGPESSKVESD